MAKSLRYDLFDFILESDLELPEVPEYNKSNSPKSDIVYLRLSKTLNALENPDISEGGGMLQVSKGQFLYKIHNTVTYYIERGQTICIDIIDKSRIAEIRSYFFSTVMAGLLYQRGFILLHASAVQKDGHVSAFVGKSGYGKSTLATFMLSKGFRLVTDDILALKYSVSNEIMVCASYPFTKLWDQSLKVSDSKSDMQIEPLKNFKEEKKYIVKMKSSKLFTSGYFTLSELVFLSIDSDKNSYSIQRLTPKVSIEYLLKASFRFRLALGLQSQESHFKFICSLIKHIKIYETKRPSISENIDDFGNFVYDHLT